MKYALFEETMTILIFASLATNAAQSFMYHFFRYWHNFFYEDGLCFHVPEQLKSWKTSAAMYIHQETISVLVDLGLQYLEKEEELGIAKWGELKISLVRTFKEFPHSL